MNFRVIIHALILIFIIHIIVINIDYEVSIGKEKEHFHIKKEKVEKKDDSLNFLLENKENDNEFIKKMKSLSSEVKESKDVIPSNGYLDNSNVPNFESNVEDTSKFYKIQNNYDTLNEKQLQSTSLEDLHKKNNIVQEINKINPNVRESEEKPNTWEYNNELAMNGGSMNGIMGFDGLESQYAGFGSSLTMEKDNKNNFENVPHDDLRKPIVVN